MATLVLQAAGSFIGGFLGPVGAAIGSAAGSMAGYLIDRALINSTLHYKGPRLDTMRPFSAEEGAPIPRLYGTLRTGGTLIWATRFEETRRSHRQGLKGGAKVTNFNYFANAAFGLCEGPIAGVRRIWADGREIDLSQVEIRIHNGNPDQMPDTLIEAKQGNPPAFRGVAYAVIERFPLDDFGNRLPQFQFEVIRPVGDFGSRIQAITLIPGASEHGLSNGSVAIDSALGVSERKNRHLLFARSDIDASLDELAMVCPNLRHVALVVAWFGDDLRAGSCKVYPAVVGADDATGWSVGGLSRSSARSVSRHEGAPAYGGTPSDRSVIEAIAAIKERGWAVTLYPFVMMDVAADNDLPDPYGGSRQSAYPWRGRITCHPAPGLEGSADKTGAARTEVEQFCGEAGAVDFLIEGADVSFEGDPDDWGYRRMVLHYAHLAKVAGGVDAFLVGSELRGLTMLRDETNAFPFVEQLVDLTSQVRSVLGAETKLTYAADWSEYFGHQPQDGSGDVFFHLDPLWASDNIDAIGIDNYMPLSDWRDEDVTGGNPDGFASPYDHRGLRAGINSGEGFDWFYASQAARLARARSPIEDGAADRPWVFRYKDLVGWWSNSHHDRIGGVESLTATDWIPMSKPIWFTELGCAAADKGPNQPNVFPDPKSSENALPHFSSGGRSEAAQRRFLEAHFDHWDSANSRFVEAGNPVSPIYGGHMVDAERIYCWTWDARPFPAFPLLRDVWADGENWLRGHWLTGRVASPSMSDLIGAILSDCGIENVRSDEAGGIVSGYVVSDPGTARQALSPLIELFGLAVTETGGQLTFRTIGEEAGAPSAVTDPIAADGRRPAIERARATDQESPSEVTISFIDMFADYQMGSARAADTAASALVTARLDFPGVMDAGQVEALATDWLRRARDGRETIRFATTVADRGPSPGYLVRLPGRIAGDHVVTAVDEGLMRTVEARRLSRMPPTPDRSRLPLLRGQGPQTPGVPLPVFLDLPSVDGSAAEDRFCLAVFAKPWRSQQVLAAAGTTGFDARTVIARPATIGRLLEPLGPGFEGRFDKAGTLLVHFPHGELSSVDRTQVLNGANVLAVKSAIETWEIIQFARAEEVAPEHWRLSDLLRGQLGTIDAALAGADQGTDVVLLDDAVQPAGLKSSETGLAINWRVGPTGYDMTDEFFALSQQVGGLRALLPLAPVHLKLHSGPDGSLKLSWIRRGRLDADSWLASEIPLGEASESYRVTVAPVGGTPLRDMTVDQPNWTYATAWQAADFPSRPVNVEIAVRQVSQVVGDGVMAKISFELT